MPDFSLLIPFDPGSPERERIHAWLLERWQHYLPEAEIVVAGAGKRSLAASRNLCAEQATTDKLFFIDADGTAAIGHVRQAMAFAADNRRAVKFRSCCCLTQAGTETVLARSPRQRLDIEPEWVSNTMEPLPGLVFACTRAAFEQAGRFDERFVGWGGEDNAFTAATATLTGLTVLPYPAYHLWHPRYYETGGEHDRHSATAQANRALARRYRKAEGRVEAMRRLVAER